MKEASFWKEKQIEKKKEQNPGWKALTEVEVLTTKKTSENLDTQNKLFSIQSLSTAEEFQMTPLISSAALARTAEGGECFHRRTCLPELPTREENTSLPPDPLCSSSLTAFFCKASSQEKAAYHPVLHPWQLLGVVGEFTPEAI